MISSTDIVEPGQKVAHWTSPEAEGSVVSVNRNHGRCLVTYTYGDNRKLTAESIDLVRPYSVWYPMRGWHGALSVVEQGN